MAAADGIDRRTLSRAIKRINPVWELRTAERIGTGPLAVYRVTVETPSEDTSWYLKLTPAGGGERVRTEARLLALLEETDIPVPAVRGLVEDEPELPAPFLMVHEMLGRTVDRRAIDEISSELLANLAYESGQHLAELHRLDVVDSFGYLEPRGSVPSGDVPTADPASIAVTDAYDPWADRLDADRATIVAGLEGTTFADMTETVDRGLASRIETLTGSFSAVLARIDHSIENLRILGNRIVGTLDWEFTLAATPGYDLEQVSWSLAGGPFLYGTEITDRRELVRERVLAGYVDADGPGDPDQFRNNRDCYAAVTTARSMQLLDQWDDIFDFTVSRDVAATRLREEFERQTEDGS